MSRDKLNALEIDLDEVGYHMPPESADGRKGSGGCDDDEVPDSDDDDDDDDDELGRLDLLDGHDVAALQSHQVATHPTCHVGGDGHDPEVESPERDELSSHDLSTLRSIIAGESDQHKMLASGPVQSIDEMLLAMKLIHIHSTMTSRKKTKGKQQHDIDYQAVAPDFNKELKRRHNGDLSYLSSSGMKVKSPADIADFIRRADEGIQLEASVAGVRQKLLELRRLFKDSSAQFMDAQPVVPASKRQRNDSDSDDIDDCDDSSSPSSSSSSGDSSSDRGAAPSQKSVKRT